MNRFTNPILLFIFTAILGLTNEVCLLRKGKGDIDNLVMFLVGMTAAAIALMLIVYG